MFLLTSAARSSSGTGGSVRIPSGASGAVLLLDLTAAATDAIDTLNVRVQHTIDGASWDDFVSFTQCLGNGGAKQHVAVWSANYTPESEMHALADGSLAAGSVLQGPVGGLWRVKYTIVDADADCSFTFSVQASFR